MGLWDFGNYTPKARCTDSPCWDDKTWTRSSIGNPPAGTLAWSPHQVWFTAWGGNNTDYSASAPFPEEYNTGNGTYWKWLNDGAHATGHSRILYAAGGVLYGCHVLNQDIGNPTDAYKHFAAETYQRPAYLTEIDTASGQLC
jgi:hypothetical protein